MRSVLFLNLIICFLFVAVNNAYAFRCGTEPIGLWDRSDKVLKYCGMPFKKSSKRVYYKNQHVYAETWFYNCGEGDFIYEVAIYDGIVVSEGPTERGSGPSQCGK